MARFASVDENINSSNPASGLVGEKDYDALKQDMNDLRADVTKFMDDLSGVVKDKSKKSFLKGKETAEEARVKFEKARDDVQERIREKPLTAVGIAVGVGVLLALAAKR